ncbi:MAG: NAD(P)-dependent oxidoreductase [Myxococcota bacterium]
MSSSDDGAFAAEQEIGRINAFFPILPTLSNRWAASRPWEGRTVALNLHLTTLSGALVRELTLGGGTFVVSAASKATTDKRTVALLRNQGITVYTGGDGEDRHTQALSHDPDLLVDVGFDLIQATLDRRKDLHRRMRGAVEATRSGTVRLKEASVPFPVVNINDGRLKTAVENRHGVGEAVWQAVQRLTGMHLSGRRVAVVGYGPVGKGLAAYARAAGMAVEVVERSPVKRLLAHYDGYPTPSLRDAVQRVGVLVTATGRAKSIRMEHLVRARDGLVLLNAGHGGDELDMEGIASASAQVDNISDDVVRYRLHGGPRVTILGKGYPLNIVLNSGSPEPVLLQYALLGLALDWVANSDLPKGEVMVSEALEDQAATLALEALDQTGG